MNKEPTSLASDETPCSAGCEFRQVAALLNLKLLLLADTAREMDLEDIRLEIAEIEIERVKITTDPEYRQQQFRANAWLFSLPHAIEHPTKGAK